MLQTKGIDPFTGRNIDPKIEFKLHEVEGSEKTNFLFIRKYGTHYESWEVTQADEPTSHVADWYAQHGVQTSEGVWYMVYHNFHNTEADADRHRGNYIHDYTNIGDSVWEVHL